MSSNFKDLFLKKKKSDSSPAVTPPYTHTTPYPLNKHSNTTNHITIGTEDYTRPLHEDEGHSITTAHGTILGNTSTVNTSSQYSYSSPLKSTHIHNTAPATFTIPTLYHKNTAMVLPPSSSTHDNGSSNNVNVNVNTPLPVNHYKSMVNQSIYSHAPTTTNTTGNSAHPLQHPLPLPPTSTHPTSPIRSQYLSPTGTPRQLQPSSHQQSLLIQQQQKQQQQQLPSPQHHRRTSSDAGGGTNTYFPLSPYLHRQPQNVYTPRSYSQASPSHSYLHSHIGSMNSGVTDVSSIIVHPRIHLDHEPAEDEDVDDRHVDDDSKHHTRASSWSIKYDENNSILQDALQYNNYSDVKMMPIRRGTHMEIYNTASTVVNDRDRSVENNKNVGGYNIHHLHIQVEGDDPTEDEGNEQQLQGQNHQRRDDVDNEVVNRDRDRVNKSVEEGGKNHNIQVKNPVIDQVPKDDAKESGEIGVAVIDIPTGSGSSTVATHELIPRLSSSHSSVVTQEEADDHNHVTIASSVQPPILRASSSSTSATASPSVPPQNTSLPPRKVSSSSSSSTYHISNKTQSEISHTTLAHRNIIVNGKHHDQKEVIENGNKNSIDHDELHINGIHLFHGEEVYTVTVEEEGAAQDPSRMNVPETSDPLVYSHCIGGKKNASLLLPKNRWLEWPLGGYYPYVVDSMTQRMTCLIYAIFAIVLIIYRDTEWMKWCIVGGVIDSGVRSIAGDRIAVLSCIAEICANMMIPNNFEVMRMRSIVGAPRQFTAILYTLYNMTLLFLAFFFIDTSSSSTLSLPYIVVVVLLALQAFLMCTEIFNLSLPSIFFHEILTKRLGWINDQYIHHAYETVKEAQRSQKLHDFIQQYIPATRTVILKAKRASSASPLTQIQTDSSTPGVQNGSHRGDGGGVTTGDDKNQVGNEWREILRYHSTSSASTESNKNPLLRMVAHCSALYLLPIFGLAGITNGWYYASISPLFLTSALIWQILSICTAALYFIYLLVFFLRSYLLPHTLLREWIHPTTRYTVFLFFTIPLLLITPTVQYYPTLCEVVFWMTAPLIMLLSIHMMKDWFANTSTVSQQYTPMWQMIVISMMIVALQFPLIYPSSAAEVIWFYTSFTILIWFIVLTITFIHCIFYPYSSSSHSTSRSTLVLTIASSALMFLTTLQLDTSSTTLPFTFQGAISELPQFFFWVTQLFTLFCFYLLLHRYLLQPSSSFTMMYWVYSFPLATLSLSWIYYASITPHYDSTVYYVITICIYVICHYGNGVLLGNTILAIIQKRLSNHDDESITNENKSYHLLDLQSLAFYHAMMDMTDMIHELMRTGHQTTESVENRDKDHQCTCHQCIQSPDSSKATTDNKIRTLYQLIYTFDKCIRVHLKMIDRMITELSQWNTHLSMKHTPPQPSNHPLIHQLEKTKSSIDHLIQQMNHHPSHHSGIIITTPSADQHHSTHSRQSTLASLHMVQTCIHELVSVGMKSLNTHEHLYHTLLQHHYFTNSTTTSQYMVRKICDSTSVVQWCMILPFIMTHLSEPSQRIQYLTSLQDGGGGTSMLTHNSNDMIPFIGTILAQHLGDPFLWQRMCREVPELTCVEMRKSI